MNEVKLVKLNKLSNTKGSTKAYASIQLPSGWVVNDIKVYSTKGGSIRVAMPQRSYKDAKGDTKYIDVAHPTTASGRKEISDLILNAYNGQVSEQKGDVPF